VILLTREEYMVSMVEWMVVTQDTHFNIADTAVRTRQSAEYIDRCIEHKLSPREAAQHFMEFQEAYLKEFFKNARVIERDESGPDVMSDDIPF